MLEELVLRTTAIYALMNIGTYALYVHHSIMNDSKFNLKDNINMGLQNYVYNFKRNQIMITVLNAPPILYDLYQMIQR